MPLETSAIVQRGRPAAPSSDYLLGLVRIVERHQQRIEELERKLDDEIQRRRVLSSRVDMGEIVS